MSARKSSRLKRRIAVPVLALAVLLMAAELLGGASSPLISLSMSGAFLVLTVLVAALTGPSFITPGLTVAAVLATLAATLLIVIHGEPAAPAAAAGLAGGGIWLIGALTARRPVDADFAVDAVIWTSFLFCCVRLVTASNGTLPPRDTLLGSFASPADIPLLFTLFLIVAAGRLLQIHGRAPRLDITPVIWTEELIHRGVGALLLAGVSLTGLILCASAQGVLAALAGICLLIFMRPAEDRKVRRSVPGLAVAAALGLASLAAAFLPMETLGTEPFSFATSAIQRWSIYLGAVPEALMTGHGPGSIREIADRSMTLSNASILASPGGVRNALIHHLVEWGILGAVIMTAGLIFIHQPITPNQASPRFARSASRMALATGAAMLLWALTSSSLDTPVIGWLYVFLLGIAAGSDIPQRAGGRSPVRDPIRSFPSPGSDAGLPTAPDLTRSGVAP